MQDLPRRSFAKSLSWRVVATATTVLVAYLLTGSWGEAGGIALVVAVISTLMYYLHERVWDRVAWGRRKPR